MHSIFFCLLGVVLNINGASLTDIPGADGAVDLHANFLAANNNVQKLMDLMNSHFSISLDYLFASKFFGSQYVERPGMTKLLVKESDRHWEEGMNVLQRYLHLGGLTNNDHFLEKMSFAGKNDLPSMLELNEETMHVNYANCLKTVMENSRNLVDVLSDMNHKATRKLDGAGDAGVAHFIQEKAEEEFEVARKMAGYYQTLQKMENLGIALDAFDKEL